MSLGSFGGIFVCINRSITEPSLIFITDSFLDPSNFGIKAI